MRNVHAIKLYLKNFEIYHNISIYLFYFPGAAAEPLGSARGALRAPRSTGWEPLFYTVNRLRCVVELVLFTYYLNFLDRFSRNPQISNFVNIRSVRAELFHPDIRTSGQADITKLIVAVRNFAKAPKTVENTGKTS